MPRRITEITKKKTAMNWRDIFHGPAFKVKTPPSLTEWDDAPVEDELVARKPRVEILKKEEAGGRKAEAGGAVMALTAEEMNAAREIGEDPDAVLERKKDAAAEMRAFYAARKAARRNAETLASETLAQVAGLPEETVGRMLGLERLKVRELEGRLIEMESRARLAEARVVELEGAVDFGHGLLRTVEDQVARYEAEAGIWDARCRELQAQVARLVGRMKQARPGDGRKGRVGK